MAPLTQLKCAIAQEHNDSNNKATDPEHTLVDVSTSGPAQSDDTIATPTQSHTSTPNTSIVSLTTTSSSSLHTDANNNIREDKCVDSECSSDDEDKVPYTNKQYYARQAAREARIRQRVAAALEMDLTEESKSGIVVKKTNGEATEEKKKKDSKTANDEAVSNAASLEKKEDGETWQSYMEYVTVPVLGHLVTLHNTHTKYGSTTTAAAQAEETSEGLVNAVCSLCELDGVYCPATASALSSVEGKDALDTPSLPDVALDTLQTEDILVRCATCGSYMHKACAYNTSEATLYCSRTCQQTVHTFLTE